MLIDLFWTREIFSVIAFFTERKVNWISLLWFLANGLIKEDRNGLGVREKRICYSQFGFVK